MSSSRMVLAVAFVLGCRPDTGSPPESAPPPATPTASAPSTASAETCLLGPLPMRVSQRMVQDNGVTALLEDQRIGDVAVLFAAQKQALEAPPPSVPGPRPPAPPPPYSELLLARGTTVAEELEDLEYVARPDGAKPTETTTRRKSYTYFLVEAAWDCAGAAAEIEALGLPKGQVSAGACVPAEQRARCRAVAP